MILTFKVKHEQDFSNELEQARKIAEYGIANRMFSSKDVKQFGLKSVISNQILRKYARNKQAKRVSRVKLTIPNQGVKITKDTIVIPALKLTLPFDKKCEKVNQVELDNEYAYISVTVKEAKQMKVKNWIGVDRNTTGHIAVVGNPKTGKVWKLGKEAIHIHKKYSELRCGLQKKGKYKLVKAIKQRESHIVRNLNHHVSKKIVSIAKTNKSGIKLENLKGIRQSSNRTAKSFRYSLNSWSFYQLQQMIEYKARLLGVPVVYVNPKNTSKECSRCGVIGLRKDKEFKCPNGHVDNADVNASFNIALRQQEASSRFNKDRDLLKGNSDIPKEATLITTTTLEPHFI